MERWKKISENRNYEVSDLGKVRKNKLILKMDYDPRCSNSYPRINLWKNGQRVRRMIHLLVLSNFVGPKPKGKEANHIDGNKGNVTLKNLEYITRSENHKYAYSVCGQRRMQGSLHGRSKLTEKQIKEIRTLRGNINETGIPWKTKGHGKRIRYQPGSGKTLREIARQYDVCTSTISFIVNRRKWKHV